MAAPQNFRSAFNGFNREDVVHYLEYLNAKHSNRVNQLVDENDALREMVNDLQELENQQHVVDSLEEKCAELTRQLELSQAHGGELEQQVQAARARCQELEQQMQSTQTRCQELEQQLAQARPKEPAVQEPVLSSIASDELEAYRRAERIEREAKERAELVYFQATNVLTEASAKVDGISTDITQMADQVISQLTQLQMAVSSSKLALQDASSIMGAIRPNK